MTKNKHGTDCDDATKLAEIHRRARTGAVVFDAKAGKRRVRPPAFDVRVCSLFTGLAAGDIAECFAILTVCYGVVVV